LALLFQLQLQAYDAILGAVNEGGIHWVLMVRC